MLFIDEVVGWYHKNKRDLPWRNTNDPYIIWLSEIIMQQTRVEQGLPYFNRFAEEYPRVEDFAAAAEGDILNIWQGLGYYSRGRNMHAAAKMVMEDYEGYFPTKYDELLKLKGVGEYTAAAISSFSSNEAKAVVDGNVFRLLSRFFGIREIINSPRGKKVFTTLANDIIDRKNAGLSNQAMMEFGSLVCKPKNPACAQCPLQPGCYAYRQDEIAFLPVKKKTAAPRLRYFNYIVAATDDSILMNKRGPKDIWENLYDFPLFETPFFAEAGEVLMLPDFIEAFGTAVVLEAVHQPVKHQLSHQTIMVQFIIIQEFKHEFLKRKKWKFISFPALKNVAKPKIIFSFLGNFLT